MITALLCAAVMATAASSVVYAGEEEKTEATAENGVKFTKEYETLMDDLDEPIEYVPARLLVSQQAEMMMQLTGYTYSLEPIDDTTYHFIVELECGTPGEDTALYLKRTYTWEGNYTVDGDVYTLEPAEHFNMVQESAGAFAATSGEGGADYWGPNGLEIDETFENTEGYNIGASQDPTGEDSGAVSTGEGLLKRLEECTVTVDGDEIVSFGEIEE